jgi:DNA-binding CsgD family transcriptional regulator/tetratricopeptide (TPR) repeat protein
MVDSALGLGREAFRCKRWADAYARLSEADRDTPLALDDLEALTLAAELIGRRDESLTLRERAYREGLDAGDRARAARCAFWSGMALMHKGEAAQAGGWFERSSDLLDESADDCAERGYLLLPSALQMLFGGNAAGAEPIFTAAIDIGERCHEVDLATLGRLGRGHALIRLGRVVDGTSWLDRAMLAVTAGDASPTVCGIVYCTMIEACHEIFDVARAQEWTDALTRWCESQPDLVPFRGQCLVHRAELMRMHGAWDDAMIEAQRAYTLLSDPPGQPAIGTAWYEQAELCRLRGDFTRAEEAYKQAHQFGREPQPGLALLRLAQGRLDAGEAAIRRVVEESQGEVIRSTVLAAYVEIVSAANDLDAARAAASELAELAAKLDAPFLDALSAYAAGTVALASGDARAAAGLLRQASTSWQQLDAQYDAARARVLLGLAFSELGDVDGAQMELDAARQTFQRLGAAPDLVRLDALTRATPKSAPGLTGREVEVLGLLATGKTNREIADALIISEKTVARHVSNLFVKLGVNSRSAATAYAFKHDLA